MPGVKPTRSESPDPFQDLNHKELYKKAQKWFKLYPSLLDRVTLHHRAYPRSNAAMGGRIQVLYVVLFWLVDNDFTKTYKELPPNYKNLSKLKMPRKIPEDGIGALPWKKRKRILQRLYGDPHHKNQKGEPKPIKPVDFLDTETPLPPEYEKIRTLERDCRRASEGQGDLWIEPLFMEDFPQVYKSTARPEGDAYRWEWQFHPMFPREEMPDIVDQEEPPLVLYDRHGDITQPTPEPAGEIQKHPQASKKFDYVFRRIGKTKTWEIIFNGREIGIFKGDGFAYFHFLMQRTRESGPIDAVELHRQVRGTSEDGENKLTRDQVPSEGLNQKRLPNDDQQELISPKTLTEYRERLKTLPGEIENAKSKFIYQEAQELERERDLIAAELKRALKPGRNPTIKTFLNDREKIQGNVRGSIRRALGELVCDQEVHEHFRKAFKPGAKNHVYNPPIEIPWVLK